MKRRITAAFISIVLLSVPVEASIRGNININYQQSQSGGGADKTWSTAQIMNVSLMNRVLYSNDYILSAYLIRTRNSTRNNADMRIRYSLNLSGHRYNLYATYSPFKISRAPMADQYNRIFQATLNYMPILFPQVSLTYGSNRIFTRDNPRTTDALNRTYSASTQFFKSFGSFRGTHLRQESKPDLSSTQRQIRTTDNFGYEIGKSLPGKIGVSASYSYTGNKDRVYGIAENSTKSHNGAVSAGKQFGRWFNVSSAFSGRQVDFKRETGSDERIRNYGVTVAGTANPRDKLSLVLLRGYNSNEDISDSTLQLINDYVNFGANYRFEFLGGREASISVSRSLYLQSNLGRSTADNGIFIADIGLYRNTDVTINLGITHNDKALSGAGRYQMSRTVNLISRPVSNMTFTFNYQSSRSGTRPDLFRSDNDNISMIISQTLKRDFNYTVTYTKSITKAAVRNSTSSLSTAINYRISRNISLLGTYSRRDIGSAIVGSENKISETVSGRIGWIMTRKSSLTFNYTVTNLNQPNRVENLGGYFVVSF